MASMIVMTNYYLKAEYSDELKAYINRLVHTNLDDPLHYMSYEQWASPEHFEKHLKSDHVTDAFTKTKGMFTKISVTKMKKTYDD